MLLEQFHVEQLGPFREPLDIPIDPRVTVLTGANDAGKTSVLKAIRLLLTQAPAAEKDINRDHLLLTPAVWRRDTTASLTGVFKVTSHLDIPGIGQAVDDSYYATLRRNPAPDAAVTRFEVRNSGRRWDNHTFPLPSCISINLEPDAQEIRSIVPLEKPNPLEKSLLHVAFGGPYNFEKFKALSQDAWEDALSNAQDRLNGALHSVVPASDYFEFRFRGVGEGNSSLAVSIRDTQRAVTPFDYRGSGARKMIQIVSRLLVEGLGGVHRIILIDEPENSLHADAQHLLREFLYSLTADKKTQVIYSTHSPCMLNPMRPHQIRLLERARKNDKATTVLRKRPEELGFVSVRSSWGVTAADSLFFAPVVAIVEGPTEIHSIPLMIQKIAEAKAVGFQDYDKLLGLVNFLDGQGQNLVVVAKIVMALGARVVVLIDGDKNKASIQKEFRDKQADVPVIRLQEGTEFENLLPEDIYFDALAREMGAPDTALLKNNYKNWCEKNPESAKFLLTKRIKKWLGQEYADYTYLKPEVMRKAVEIASADQFVTDPLKAVLAAIRTHLEGTSFSSQRSASDKFDVKTLVD